MHTFDLATIITWLIGSGLPILVGILTKVTTHPAIKGAVLALLAAVTGVLSQWLDALNSHTAFGWQPVVIGALGAFAVGQASHVAILSHTPLSNSVTAFGTWPTAIATTPVKDTPAADDMPATVAPDVQALLTTLNAAPAAAVVAPPAIA